MGEETDEQIFHAVPVCGGQHVAGPCARHRRCRTRDETVPPPRIPDSVTELNILWAQWDPANYLAELGKDYQAATDIKVNVLQEPWGSFYSLVNNELTSGLCGFDAVLGDSQWLGEFAGRDHYAELTGLLRSPGPADSVTPASLKYYGEYPPGSGRLWAFPAEGDAIGWAYRKDLFENPAE